MPASSLSKAKGRKIVRHTPRIVKDFSDMLVGFIQATSDDAPRKKEELTEEEKKEIMRERRVGMKI